MFCSAAVHVRFRSATHEAASSIPEGASEGVVRLCGLYAEQASARGKRSERAGEGSRKTDAKP